MLKHNENTALKMFSDSKPENSLCKSIAQLILRYFYPLQKLIRNYEFINGSIRRINEITNLLV